MTGRHATLGGVLLLLVGLGLGRSATAGNTVHPRTPVLWPEVPCMALVVRSESPSFAFDYEIPIEDTELSVDELEDSRRHQFLGFCRQWPAGRPPPRYVSLADLERAVNAGLDDPALFDDPEATLETSPSWAGCWTRITPDDDRRPITEAAAAEPVVWDISEVPAGTWLIAGYTWEPPYSLWSRAPWLLRVYDEPDPPAPQAAAVIGDTPDYVDHDDTLPLPICLSVEADSSFDLQWAASKDEELVWQSLGQDILGDMPPDGVEFVPPVESFGLTVLLRAVVDQPNGDDYIAHALAPVIVFAPPDPGDGDGDGDADGDGTGGSEGTDTGETSGAPPSNSGRCSLTDERGNLGIIALGLLGLAGVRRRRSARR